MKNLKKISKNRKLHLIFNTIIFYGVTSFFSLANGEYKIWINRINGNAFIKTNDQIQTAKEGFIVNDLGTLYVEENSQVVLSDAYDHKFYMAGPGQIKVFNKFIELISGHLWIQSFKANKQFEIHTANAITKYKDGEAILSFDNLKGKTQLLTLKGVFQLANILRPLKSVELLTGEFSFVDNNVTQGLPRRGTPVGQSSFSKVMAIFNNLDIERNPANAYNLMKKLKKSPQGGQRSISSIAPISDGQKKIIYLGPKKKVNTSKLDNIYRKNLIILDGKKPPKKPVNIFKLKTKVKVKIFGAKHLLKNKKRQYEPSFKNKDYQSKTKKKKRTRVPTSVGNSSSYNSNMKNAENQFEKSLQREYIRQKRHPGAVNNLIRELSTIRQDYNESY